MRVSRSVRNAPFSLLRKFKKQQEGYVVAITLLMLPVFAGAAAFAIDGSRLVNLHTDLQHASDAMALAGARELDGREDAIERARAAIAAFTPNQAIFAGSTGFGDLGTVQNVSFDPGNAAESSVLVEFYAEIPVDDQIPMNPADQTTDSTEAKYVRVVARPQEVNTIFPLPGIGLQTVSASAEAVARYVASTCDLSPIFICNPVEAGASLTGDSSRSFNESFADGDFYAREFRLVFNGQSSPGPGNFGFLRPGPGRPGGAELRQALATNETGVCTLAGLVDTGPGGNTGIVRQGLNTRFGIYEGPFSSQRDNGAIRPDINARAGQRQSAGNASGGNGGGRGNSNGGGGNISGPLCNAYSPEDNILAATPFPPGDSPANNTGGGGTVSAATWDLDTYWEISHGGLTEVPGEDFVAPPAPTEVSSLRITLPPNSDAAPAQPSRFDVYQYEISTNLVGDAAPNGETGVNQCHTQGGVPERRELIIPVLNCNELRDAGNLNGFEPDVPVETYARVFLTQPVVTNGNDRFISMEVVDVAGFGGLGTVEDVFREEAELVR